MDVVMLSRLQFAAATMFHFLFVPLTLGLSVLVAYMETRYVRTGDETYLRMTKFWGKLFLINFALGVVTGITLEFQFGTNWSRYSAYVGDVFGSLLAIEASVAFFLESTFIGIWIFGWKKLSKKAHAMGPLWDGNEVWLLTAGGVTFAAFPLVYAVMFSSLYSALMLILFALILRGVSFEFRNKVDSPAWKRVWDTCIFVGSFLPALLFGVAFANIFKGIPIDQDGIYLGNLFTLLNPYGLLGGVLFVCLFLVHGALWLTVRADGNLAQRAESLAGKLWPVLTGIAVVFLVASYIFTPLYDNYLANPVLFLVPAISAAAIVGIKYFLMQRAFLKAWLASAATIVSCTFFGVIGLFPNLFPSSIDPTYSLSAFNASSSPLTLKIMLIVVLLFVPVVLAYQIWAYNLFSVKVTDDDLAHEDMY